MTPPRRRLRVHGAQRDDIDVALLAQAILAIAGQTDPATDTAGSTARKPAAGIHEHTACSDTGTSQLQWTPKSASQKVDHDT